MSTGEVARFYTYERALKLSASPVASALSLTRLLTTAAATTTTTTATLSYMPEKLKHNRTSSNNNKENSITPKQPLPCIDPNLKHVLTY